MADICEESSRVWSSKQRTVVFPVAMRHLALAVQTDGRPLRCTRLDVPGNAGSLAAHLQSDIPRLKPARR